MNPEQVEILLRLFGAMGLLFMNALLVAGEFSIIRLRLSYFNPDYPEKLKARKLPQTLLENIDQSVNVARFGNLVCALGYALTAYPLFYYFLKESGLPDAWSARHLAFLLTFAVYYLFGELLPRGLAVASPVRVLHTATLPVRLAGLMGLPIVGPFKRLSRFILKRFGMEPGLEWEALDIDEQLDSLKETPNSSQVLLKVIKNALQMREVKVQDILLPRNQVRYFDVNVENTVNLKLAEETGHTRFPLCDGDLDNCLGLIHIKDIFRSREDSKVLDFRRIKREMIWVSENDPLEKVLRKLLLRKTHMALVTDEFGGANGVVTLELILEQLVGEIQDEFDAEEELIQLTGADEYAIYGLASIRDMEEALGISLENKNEVASFGGLITAELGRIPDNGETLELEQLEVTITEVDETRVIATRVKVRQPYRDGPNEVG